MRKLLVTIAFAGVCSFLSFAQPKPEDTVTQNQRFYFPSSLYKDSIAFDKAIPGLAEQFLVAYKEPDRKKYFSNSFHAYMLAGNYNKSIEMIDSMKIANDDKTSGIYTKSYDLAKLKEKQEHIPLEDAYKKEFTTAFNQLSFPKKIYVGLDTNYLKGMTKDYSEFKEKLKAKQKDSLSLDDAKMLIAKFGQYSVMNKVFYWVYPVTNAQQYRTMFPAIKSNPYGGVAPVQDIDDLPDTSMRYKLLFELTGFGWKDQADSLAKKDINGGIGEVARVLNLHVANGIPAKNIDAVIVVHAAALYAFMNNEKYKKKYDIDNPNIALLKELQNFGAKIIVCGQAMTFFRLEKEDLVPGIKQALTAQTVLSTYQLKGYVYYDERLE